MDRMDKGLLAGCPVAGEALIALQSAVTNPGFSKIRTWRAAGRCEAGSSSGGAPLALGPHTSTRLAQYTGWHATSI